MQLQPDGCLFLSHHYREPMTSEVVMITDNDAIFVVNRPDWEHRQAKLLAGEPFPKEDSLLALPVTGPFYTKLDSTHHLQLPACCRRIAGIRRSVMVLGCMDHLEIRSPGRWRKEEQAFIESLKEPGVEEALKKLLLSPFSGPCRKDIIS